MTGSLGTHGFDDLDRKLAQLGDPKVATRIGATVGRKAAKRVLAAIEERAPRGTRTTRRTRRNKNGEQVVSDYGRITTNLRLRKIPTPADRNTVIYTVSTNAAFWGWFQEFGTVNQAPFPFIRPAWDAVGPGLVQSIGRDMGEAIVRAATRRGLVLD